MRYYSSREHQIQKEQKIIGSIVMIYTILYPKT